MTTIKLTFKIHLRDYNYEGVNEYNGPTFHRFLPNNKFDKLEKELDTLEGVISFWFERRGEKKDGFIKYIYNKNQVEEEDISRQAILDGGLLFGEVTISKVPVELQQVLESNKTGDVEYTSFGKKVVKEIIKHSNNLINIFRDLFRQHWIESLEIWDSRTKSLGTFCQYDLSMQYSLDNGVTWSKFVPDKERHEVHGTSNIIEDYSDFILEKDWTVIKNLFENDFKPLTASFFLSQANETFNKGDLKKAFIEAVTALEKAMKHVLKENPKITNSISGTIQSFLELPLPSKFGLISLLCDSIDANDIENSVKAIEIRNKVVHEGHTPKEADIIFLKSLFKSISNIINEPVCKFPVPVRCNITNSVESWERIERERIKRESSK